MMIERVAAKAHNAIVVVDEVGNTKPLKLLNFVYAGGNKQDAAAVADVQSGYINGNVLLFPDNRIFIVSRITDDYHKVTKIRANLDLVLCNNYVTVSRQMPQSNNQGGVKGHVDTIMYADLPCKVIPAALKEDKESDVYLNTYVVYLPSIKPVSIGDKLQFAHSYTTAKVEGIKQITLGLFEITFDRDFRW